MTFPDDCLRGILNDNYLEKDGSAGSPLFYFDNIYTREDGWVEQSICWEDDDTVIDLLLNQKKDGQLQFKSGAARIRRAGLDALINRPFLLGEIFQYERRPEENNPYHGNLLLRSGVPKKKIVQIAATIALSVSEIIPQR